MRLMEGANIYQIAKNCRTNVGMIEKYYGVHIKNSLNAAAINVVRSGKDEMAEEGGMSAMFRSIKSLSPAASSSPTLSNTHSPGLRRGAGCLQGPSFRRPLSELD
jgi:hypothetical protein